MLFILFLESDNEIDNLIPVVTDSDLKELSFEPEPVDGGEDKQNLGKRIEFIYCYHK